MIELKRTKSSLKSIDPATRAVNAKSELHPVLYI